MRGRRRRIVLGVIVAGLTVSALAALVATRYYPAYRSALAARDDLREAQTLLRTKRLDAGGADLAVVEAQLDDAEREFRHTRQAFDDPLVRAAQRLPLLGGAAEAIEQLTDI